MQPYLDQQTERDREPVELSEQLLTSRVDELWPHPSHRHSGSLSTLENLGANYRVPPGLNQLDRDGLHPHPVLRSPEQLRLHPAMEELGWTDVVGELNGAARLREQSAPEPILITTNGTILAGFARWQLALIEKRDQVHCIEYSLCENESLSFILTHHQPSRGWNAFVRIRLALTLTPYFQQKAFENMRIGGKHKGLANLPKAEHIDVRQEIAGVAGIGSRNVGKVKTILEKADRTLLDALQNGSLTIHRAVQWCALSRTQQVEQLTRYNVNRATNKVIRRTISRLKEQSKATDPVLVLNALRTTETRNPGSVVVRATKLPKTVVLLGRDFMTDGSGPNLV